MIKHTRLGDGDWCPVEGHGRMYVYGNRQWCPHQSHDKPGDGWFMIDGKTPIRRFDPGAAPTLEMAIVAAENNLAVAKTAPPAKPEARRCSYCKYPAPRGVEDGALFGHPSCLAYLKQRGA